jgi:hypothetical protein
VNVSPTTLGVTNTLVNNGTNTLTSTVNGTAASASIINTVSNTSSVNALSTTVNGVAGSSVNIINSNALTLNGTNDLVSTVNGVAATALDITAAVRSKISATALSTNSILLTRNARDFKGVPNLKVEKI